MTEDKLKELNLINNEIKKLERIKHSIENETIYLAFYQNERFRDLCEI